MDPIGHLDRALLRRARWRMRGAWLAPLFVATMIADAVLLKLLPVEGERGMEIFGGLLAGGFANLAAIVLLAPLGGRMLRRRDHALPRSVSRDYAGAALVLCVTLALLGAGLAHRPAVRAAQRAFAAQALAVATYVHAQAPAYRSRLRRANTVELYSGYYRTCVPGDAAHRRLCLLVDTSQSPPGVRLDSQIESNEALLRFEN